MFLPLTHSHLQLSDTRRLSISTFKGQTLLDIREYYLKDGQLLPGKKGISLSVEQWGALVKAVPEVVGALGGEGDEEEVAKGEGVDGGNEDEVEDAEETEKGKEKEKEKGKGDNDAADENEE